MRLRPVGVTLARLKISSSRFALFLSVLKWEDGLAEVVALECGYSNHSEMEAVREPIERRTMLALDEARRKGLRQERHKADLEHHIASHPKPPLSPLDKFRAIKPAGQRDGFSPPPSPPGGGGDMFEDLFSPPPPQPPPSSASARVEDRSEREPFFGPGAPWLLAVCLLVAAVIYLAK